MSLPVVVTKRNFTSVTGILAYDLPQAFGFCETPAQIVVLVNSVQQSSALYTFNRAIPRVTFLAQPLIGGNIEFRTAIPISQLLSYPRGGTFPSVASERGLDKLTVLLSQISDTADFGTPGTPPTGITIPILDTRYLQLTALPLDFNTPRQSQYQNKNYIQNGNYVVQTRIAATRTLNAPKTDSSNHLVDRWYLHGDSDTPDVTQGLVFDAAVGKNVHQINRVGNTSSNLRYGQFIEDLDCRQLAGEVVTLTVKLATGTGYSGSAVGLNCVFSTNPAIRMSALAAQTPTPGISINPTAGAYTTVSLTFTMPSDVRAMAPILQIIRVAATSGVNDYVRLAEWQLEEGAYFTGFRHLSVAEATIQAMRYLEVAPIDYVFYSSANSVTYFFPIKFSVKKYFAPVRVEDQIAVSATNIAVFNPVFGSVLTNFSLHGGSLTFVNSVAAAHASFTGQLTFSCEP